MTATPPIPAPHARRSAVGRRGFTLIELLVVMTIIGILISLILVAQADAVRQAEMRATQALILKLEGGINDRLDALMQMKPLPNYAHAYLAGVYPVSGATEADSAPLMTPPALIANPVGVCYPDPNCKTGGRAQAIALADYLKSEMPDVFFLQADLSSTPAAASYPLNFAAQPYPGDPTESSGPLSALGNFILPLGHMVNGPRVGLVPTPTITTTPWVSGYGDSHYYVDPDSGNTLFGSSNPSLGRAGRGIYGASYSVAAGIYKNLGYNPAGYDLADNNGNGLIDEWGEGVDSSNVAAVTGRLLSHKHETARSEMLYALLVEGQGLLGSIFKADDFNDREVKDTDGDGLPEFVDAWGKPLQFFRWPLFYHSDTQRGQNIGADLTSASAPLMFLRPYASIYETREQNPLDPNQTLMAPAWWLSTQNSAYPFATGKGTPTNAGGGVVAFENFFHSLTEPMEFIAPSTGVDQRYWDRGGAPGLGYRRAFFSKPLILSGGPDGTLGVAMLTAPTAAAQLLLENNAAQFLPTETQSASLMIPQAKFNLSANPLSFELWDSGQDDISNHNVTAVAGSGG